MAFYKIKSGRVVGDRGVLTYVGEEGHLFYSQDDNVLRISDGVTPGGIPLSGGSGGSAFSITNISYFTNDIGYLTATNLTGYATELWIQNQNYLTVGAFSITNVSYFNNNIGYLTSSTVNTYTTAKNPFDQSLNTTDVVEFSGLFPTTTATTIGSLARPWKDIFLQSGSINIANANNTLASLLVSNSDGYLELNGGGFRIQHLGSTIFTVEAITGQLVSNAKTIITNTTNAENTTSGSLQTAGGASIQKDVWIGGKLYTNYINSNAGDLNLYADITGTVNVFGDFFHVHTTANPDPVLQVAYDGQVSLRTPTFDNNFGAFNIIGSSDGSQVPTSNTGGMIHVTGQPGTVSRIYNDSAANYALYVGRRYNGTSASPQALSSGTTIVRYGSSAYNGSPNNAGFPPAGNARMEVITTENQTPTNNGAQIQFWTIPVGTSSFSPIADIRIDSQGIIFRDNSTQDTAAIPLSYLGAPNGVAILDINSKVNASQLPVGAIFYKGAWDANLNSPNLFATSSTYETGWEYSVSNNGTQTINTITGSVTFYSGDYIIYNGNGWDRIPGNAGSVITLNGRSGVVVLTTTDITSTLGYTPYPTLTNPNGYITLGQIPTNVTSFQGRQNIVTLYTSDVVGVLTSGTISNNMLAGSISNSKLLDPYFTLGSTYINLGDTVSTITNLVTFSANSITSSNFHGPLDGNASSASKLSPGANINGRLFDGTTNITISNTGTLTIDGGLTGGSYNGSSNISIALNTATLVANAVSASTATNAGFAYSFNTATLVANAVSASTATNAGFAYSFNTATLVANAVSASTATNASYAYSFNTATLVANAVSASTATNASYAYSFNTATLVANAVSASTATNASYAYRFNTATLVANAVSANSVVGGIGVSSITAGTGTEISTSTGAVTVWAKPQEITSTSTTVAANITLDLSGPTFVTWQPSANGSRTITLTGFAPGRKIDLFITPHTNADVFTVSGVTASQCSNSINTFRLANGGSGQNSFMLSVFCTTNAIGGVWIYGNGSV